MHCSASPSSQQQEANNPDNKPARIASAFSHLGGFSCQSLSLGLTLIPRLRGGMTLLFELSNPAVELKLVVSLPLLAIGVLRLVYWWGKRRGSK